MRHLFGASRNGRSRLAPSGAARREHGLIRHDYFRIALTAGRIAGRIYADRLRGPRRDRPGRAISGASAVSRPAAAMLVPIDASKAVDARSISGSLPSVALARLAAITISTASEHAILVETPAVDQGEDQAFAQPQRRLGLARCAMVAALRSVDCSAICPLVYSHTRS